MAADFQVSEDYGAGPVYADSGSPANFGGDFGVGSGADYGGDYKPAPSFVGAGDVHEANPGSYFSEKDAAGNFQVISKDGTSLGNFNSGGYLVNAAGPIDPNRKQGYAATASSIQRGNAMQAQLDADPWSPFTWANKIKQGLAGGDVVPANESLLGKPGGIGDWFSQIGTAAKWLLIGGFGLVVYNLASKTK